MYDLSSKFNLFYNNYVVLSRTEQTKLKEKAQLNIDRIKSGLIEYNAENKTSYTIKEEAIQGSVAMSTVVQNEDDDYDIDVAIVFDKSEIEDMGPQAIRNMVANALKRKTKQFNAEPEVKTSCIRVKYVDGYHIDFAIYRRIYDNENACWIYEHAGNEWTRRDLNELCNWFSSQNSNSNSNLRKIVRLSKMFCKSRNNWGNMPSGLLQTVLCDEQFQDAYERIDELFYYTMKKIVERLEYNTSVTAPVDNQRNLTPRKSDLERLIMWKKRLKSKLEDLDVLFKNDCSYNDAIHAWHGFFNHKFWNDQLTETDTKSTKLIIDSTYKFDDTEQYIEDLYQVNISDCCSISCTINGNGWRPMLIGDFLSRFNKYLPHNLEIRCNIDSTSCVKPYKTFWKVKNVGLEAKKRNCIRGQIVERGNTIVEHSSFYGPHYIECYIIKNGVCVAISRVNVPIG